MSRCSVRFTRPPRAVARQDNTSRQHAGTPIRSRSPVTRRQRRQIRPRTIPAAIQRQLLHDRSLAARAPGSICTHAVTANAHSCRDEYALMRPALGQFCSR